MTIEKFGFTSFLVRFLIAASMLLQEVSSQFCDVHVTTWDSLVRAINDYDGIVFLCPFHIKGNECSSDTRGYKITENSRIQLLCEPSFLRDSESASACIIDCPGTHFDILPNGSLVLDGITHRGATTSAIRIQGQGSLTLINSVLENNYNDFGNGGAISARQNSIMDIEFSRFQNNQGLYGGAIFHFGGAFITGSTFLDNQASEGGGGAIYTGSGSASMIANNVFAGNQASLFGPAVFDGTGGITSQGQNSGCENLGSIDCDGVSSFVDGVEKCQSFSTSCIAPTSSPTSPSSSPSTLPSQEPSQTPSQLPSWVPSFSPSNKPSSQPSVSPSSLPSFLPSLSPSYIPSNTPSIAPSVYHSFSPTATVEPSNQPSSIPSLDPSTTPSSRPSIVPTKVQSELPSQTPSFNPSFHPTTVPTKSLIPTTIPTVMRSDLPTLEPTSTVYPSNQPSMIPSIFASNIPSTFPSVAPTSQPTAAPSRGPSLNPTILHSDIPTMSLTPSTSPSNTPSFTPSVVPTRQPTAFPSQMPSFSPSKAHSDIPTTSLTPSTRPSNSPSLSVQPSNIPSTTPTRLPSLVPSAGPTQLPSIAPSTSLQPSTNQPSVTPSPYYSLLLKGERIESGGAAVESMPKGYSIRQDEEGRLLIAQEGDSSIVWEKNIKGTKKDVTRSTVTTRTFFAKLQGDCNFLIKETYPVSMTYWSTKSSQAPNHVECGLAVFPSANRVALYKGPPPYDNPDNVLWWEPLL